MNYIDLPASTLLRSDLLDGVEATTSTADHEVAVMDGLEWLDHTSYADLFFLCGRS